MSEEFNPNPKFINQVVATFDAQPMPSRRIKSEKTLVNFRLLFGRIFIEIKSFSQLDG